MNKSGVKLSDKDWERRGEGGGGGRKRVGEGMKTQHKPRSSNVAHAGFKAEHT